MTNSSIETLLQEAGLWQGPVTLRPLKGGYLNEVILVQTGAAKLVLKRFAPETTGTLFPNRPEDEARALKRLEGLDVAPRLLGFWADASMMIYDYVEGSPWQSGTADVARLLLRKEAAGMDRKLVQFRLKDPEPLLFHNEAIVRDGRIVGPVTSGNYGHFLGGAVGLGYVPCEGQTEADILGSRYEIEVAGVRHEAVASLTPMHDPKSERVRG